MFPGVGPGNPGMVPAWDLLPVWGEVYRGLDEPQLCIWAGQCLQRETTVF